MIRSRFAQSSWINHPVPRSAPGQWWVAAVVICDSLCTCYIRGYFPTIEIWEEHGRGATMTTTTMSSSAEQWTFWTVTISTRSQRNTPLLSLRHQRQTKIIIINRPLANRTTATKAYSISSTLYYIRSSRAGGGGWRKSWPEAKAINSNPLWGAEEEEEEVPRRRKLKHVLEPSHCLQVTNFHCHTLGGRCAV